VEGSRGHYGNSHYGQSVCSLLKPPPTSPNLPHPTPTSPNLPQPPPTSPNSKCTRLSNAPTNPALHRRPPWPYPPERVRHLAVATANTRTNSAPFRNVLLYGTGLHSSTFQLNLRRF